MAATTGPTLEDRSGRGTRRGDDQLEAFLRLLDLGVEAPEIVEQLLGELDASGSDRAVRFNAIEQRSRFPCGNLVRQATRDEVAQHRMQPTRDPVPLSRQVALALRPQLHHRGMVLGAHHLWRGRAERSDGHRSGVVGVVLVGRFRRQQPDPRRELGLHVDDVFAGGDELLGKQVAEPGLILDRPRALRELRRPLEQPVELLRSRPHPQLAGALLALVDRHRGVRPLVRVDPDHHCHQPLVRRRK